jgi:hypothetical protein
MILSGVIPHLSPPLVLGGRLHMGDGRFRVFSPLGMVRGSGRVIDRTVTVRYRHGRGIEKPGALSQGFPVLSLSRVFNVPLRFLVCFLISRVTALVQGSRTTRDSPAVDQETRPRRVIERDRGFIQHQRLALASHSLAVDGDEAASASTITGSSILLDVIVLIIVVVVIILIVLDGLAGLVPSQVLVMLTLAIANRAPGVTADGCVNNEFAYHVGLLSICADLHKFKW